MLSDNMYSMHNDRATYYTCIPGMQQTCTVDNLLTWN